MKVTVLWLREFKIAIKVISVKNATSSKGEDAKLTVQGLIVGSSKTRSPDNNVNLIPVQNASLKSLFGIFI